MQPESNLLPIENTYMLIPSGGRNKMIGDAGTGGRKFSPT